MKISPSFILCYSLHSKSITSTLTPNKSKTGSSDIVYLFFRRPFGRIFDERDIRMNVLGGFKIFFNS